MTKRELRTLPQVEQQNVYGLMHQYDGMDMTEDQKRGEAARQLRMRGTDPYAYRTEAELEAMRADDAGHLEALRALAGVSEEFPNGEFPVPGFNCEEGTVGY